MISRTSIIFELMLCFDREVKTCQTGNTFTLSVTCFVYVGNHLFRYTKLL